MFSRIRINQWFKVRWSDRVILKDKSMRFGHDIVSIRDFEVLQGAAGNYLEIAVFTFEEFEDLWNFESEVFLVKARF